MSAKNCKMHFQKKNKFRNTVTHEYYCAVLWDVMASSRFTQSIGMYSHVSLNDEVHNEKCVVRQFHHCVNVIECTYTNQGNVAYYTPRPYDMIYLLTAIGLTPGGSSTVQCTFTQQYIEQHN